MITTYLLLTDSNFRLLEPDKLISPIVLTLVKLTAEVVGEEITFEPVPLSLAIKLYEKLPSLSRYALRVSVEMSNGALFSVPDNITLATSKILNVL